jgi:protein-S-isoprenylcysteine O-methyltransferase Ste14
LNRNNIIALAHALAGASAIFISFLSRGQIGIPEEPIKTIGFLVFGFGMILFTYSVFNLRAAFRGNIDPTTDILIKSGPYKLVRHPLYLAMLVMSLGLAIGLRSIWGIGLTFFPFLPLCIYRARLEEGALNEKFGQLWQEYSSQTAFLIPFIY